MTNNPHLPPALADLTPVHTKQHREECGPAFHQACLEFAQSLWLQSKPAQAILQLNKSAFTSEPFPYAALKWFLEQRSATQFIGNPVRHFQHLATRMSGPRSEARTYQAWACFHLAQDTLPEEEFPPDFQQLTDEKIIIPSYSEIYAALPESDKSALQVLAIPTRSPYIPLQQRS
ncbi:hypothetical protein N9Z02_02455 [Akkermansiaceae bacterium]|nr:hypothetical protein [Akkermansiaceae bacterium]